MEKKTFMFKVSNFFDHLFTIINSCMDMPIHLDKKRIKVNTRLRIRDFFKTNVSKVSNASKSVADIGMPTTCT